MGIDWPRTFAMIRKVAVILDMIKVVVHGFQSAWCALNDFRIAEKHGF